MAEARDFEVGAAPSTRSRGSRKISLVEASAEHGDGEDRPEYGSNLELLLTLVGYAVGLGNIWRFPYLAYTYGGGAFLVPYFTCLVLLGLPLFILEMGMGQMYRQGTLGVWNKLGQPHFAGVGIAATICTFLVCLYYNMILGWTIYYLYRTVMAVADGWVLPWADEVKGKTCPPIFLLPLASDWQAVSDSYDANEGNWDKNAFGKDKFLCPEKGIPEAKWFAGLNASESPKGYPGLLPGNFMPLLKVPKHCPAAAARRFWEEEVLQQSAGFSDIWNFEFHIGLCVSLTLAWILVYFIIFKGVQSSGKVVYVTALLPYVALIAFFFRAMTLEGAGAGLKFYLVPDFNVVWQSETWIRAATQIFYSLGVGFGSLIAFASYSDKKTDFAKQSTQVAIINCGTSFFAGFVVFPILGFLCAEMSHVNPCIEAENLKDLASIGLSGTGLAFIAFPIAISQMGTGQFFWALLFFLMLFCLGIDSQFAMVESVMTVIHDAGIGKSLPKSMVCAILCGVSWVLGIVLFCTKAGIYWFQLFDYYTCVVAMFFVTIMECLGMMLKNGVWDGYVKKVKDNTGRDMGQIWTLFYKFICPVLIAGLLALSIMKFDLMGAADSKPFPEGSGLYPTSSVYIGWFLGLVPIAGFVVWLAVSMGTTTAPPGGVALAQAQSVRGHEVEMQG